MDSRSQETLRRIQQNDNTLTRLFICHSNYDGEFISIDSSDYSRLGAAIGNNIHLTNLRVNLGANQAMDVANKEFFNGLKINSSINDLTLHCRNQTLIGGVGHDILKSYQKINNNLTCLYIHDAVLDSEGGDAIADTLRWCRNLKTINLAHNRITDEQLLPMIDAIKEGCTSLENLSLYGDSVSNASALATLLVDTNCSLKFLNITSNSITSEGATAIAKSLANNTKLKRLYLDGNPFDPSAVGIFCTVLCNTSSLNDTYSSNHTLVELLLSDEQQGKHANLFSSIMRLNRGENKSHVAIKKILKYHSNIEIEPLFEWGMEEEGEQTLKALPYVVGWFERAEELQVTRTGKIIMLRKRSFQQSFSLQKLCHYCVFLKLTSKYIVGRESEGQRSMYNGCEENRN